MGISKHNFCSSCLRRELKFSGEDGDYGFAVNEFLETKAPAFDAMAPGTAGQMLYLWLMGQGGCFDCISEARKIVAEQLGGNALEAANQTLSKEPETRQRLEELNRFIEKNR